jgi:hypothetical protein
VGDIPADFGNLVTLQLLSLGRNKLSGTIPEELGKLSKLAILDLSDNQLRGYIPDSFRDIGSDLPEDTIIEIYVDYNYLTGGNLADKELITDNTSNFCDFESGTLQYQLTANPSTQQLSKTGEKDLYKLLSNKPLKGNTAKSLLPADCYVVRVLDKDGNEVDGLVEVRITDKGIFVKALDEIADSDNIIIEIQIKDNDGSNYSTTRIKVSTAAAVSPPAPKPAATPSSSPTPSASPEPSTSGGGTSTPPTPTPEHFTHEPYINGYADGTVKPNSNLSREEAATILWRISGKPGASYSGTYSDVNSDRWSAEAIAWAYDSGVMNGYPDGGFRPTDGITRAEFAAILIRLKHIAEQETQIFPDAIGHWANGYIGAANAHGIMTGYSDGTFKPNNPITRAEVMTAVNRLLGRTQQAEAHSDLRNPYTDLSRSHWAYWDILEASIEHQYTVK